MRVTRLFAAALALLLTALLVAPGAAAKPPMRLPTYVNDYAGVLGGGQLATVKSAVGKLYTDRHIRLWVVYVDNFSGHTGESWAQATVRQSDLGDYDALLAVAVTDRAYGFLVSSAITDAASVDAMRRDTLEPALGRGDWAGAALAAVNGLRSARPAGPAPLNWAALLGTLAVIGVAGAGLWVAVRVLRARRRAAALAAAQRLDPTDADALAGVPLETLDELSRLKVVGVDNALRTSSNELALAVGEFGAQRTEPFSRAVDSARAALARAFTVRQQLDDAIPETPAQRRELLTGVIVAAAKADRELEAQREAFEELRDLVLGAAARLDGLTQRLVALTARLPVGDQHLAALHDEFDAAALTSVAGNVAAARDRVAFAERNITRARELAARPVTGGQSELDDALRAAESGLGQAEALLDAVDSAAEDMWHAVSALPAAVTDIRAGIDRADAALRGGGSDTPAGHARELAKARDAAAAAVAGAHRAADPLGAFTRLTQADADLDRLLETVAEEQAAAERLARAWEQALFTAQSRVRGVSDYIDTRRGSIGPEARTRLAEARRRLAAAEDRRAEDVPGAIGLANAAATLAAAAQAAAQSDVAAAQRAYHGRSGAMHPDSGAMLGGIIIGSMLGRGPGGFGGSGSGWSPTSFGGSSGGGFFGGGGRF